MLSAPSTTSTRSSWRRCRWRGTLAARIQHDLDLEQLATRLVAGLEEPQVLPGEGVMQHAQCRLLLASPSDADYAIGMQVDRRRVPVVSLGHQPSAADLL
jgi:hypothetical protein